METHEHKSQKRKRRFFIENWSAGDSVEGTKFQSPVMMRCPEPTLETAELPDSESLETHPETSNFFDADSIPELPTNWSLSYNQPRENH
jgi:hypothetical protein